jgi:drug/metabolite transporter (DMT)-like permease
VSSQQAAASAQQSPMSSLAPSGAANIRRGILWMLLTSLLFVSLDATAKYLTRRYPVAEIVWARYLFHVVFSMIWAAPQLSVVLRRARFGMQAARGLALVATTGLYFIGISTIPLAEATSIQFLSPILVTALSVPLLGEQVGLRRWIGVGVGFVGAIIIVRPGAGILHAAALVVLASSFINALYLIATRVLNRTDYPLTTNIYSAAVGAAAASLFLPFGWVTPDLEGWLLMALAGFFGTTGHFCLIKAFAAAPPVAVVPFSYLGLLWSTLYGYLLFGDLPDHWTLLGALIIVGSGLYIFYRERVKKQELSPR